MTETIRRDKENIPGLEDTKVHVRFKLFALWSSLMFLYAYGDYFELYQPGKLQEMIAGRTALGPVSQGVLLGLAAVMAIPSLMPFLSLVLPRAINRRLNLVFGVAYILIMILAILGSWHFYIFLGLLEIAVTLLIVYYAWTWHRQPAL